MSPLILLTAGVILVFVPLQFLASWFCWTLYREDQTNGTALALASMVSAATVAGVLLAIPTLYFVAGVQAPFGGFLILVAIDILLPASVGVAGYLRWLRGRTDAN